MRHTVLTHALMATLLLAGFSQQSQASTANTLGNTVVKKAQALSTLSMADQAELSFNAVTKATQTYYQTYLGAHPLVDKISYRLLSYEKGEETSTATTEGVVTLKMAVEGKSRYAISINHTITHDKSTEAAGLRFTSQSTLVKPTDLTSEADELFAKIADKYTYKTEVNKENAILQNLEISPFSVEEDGETVNFNGLKLAFHSTIDDMAGGFGQMKLDFEGMNASDGTKISPISAEGGYAGNGDTTMRTTSPIVFATPEDGTEIAIDSVTAKGNMKHKTQFNMLLGNMTYTINNINITSQDMPTPFVVETVVIESDSKVHSKDMFSQRIDIKFVPAAGLVKSLSDGMVDVSQAAIQFNMVDLPAKALVVYEKMMDEIGSGQDDNSTAQQREKITGEVLKPLFEDVKKAATKVMLKLDATSTDGQIVVDSKAQIKSDSAITIEDMEKGVFDSPKVLLQLLDVNVDASIPAALLERTGMQLMVGAFLQKNGEVYEAKITSENGQLLINGAPAPF